MLGPSSIKRAGKLVLAALQYAENHVFSCILLSRTVLAALTAYSPLTSDNRGSPQTASVLVDLGYAQYQGTHLTVGVNQDLSMRCAGTSSVKSPLRLICCNLSDKSGSGD
jgi:hypothetical protein